MSVARVGLAGFMGAGKTTIAQLLKDACESTIIDADKEAKVLMETDQSIKNTLSAVFGAVVDSDGTINSKVLGKIVFSSLENLKKLNSIVHPPLLRYLHSKLFNDKSSDAGLLVLDAALIPLWQVNTWFDCLIWVESPYSDRLNRIVKKCKGTLDQTEIENRMNLQQKLFAPPENDTKWSIVHNTNGVTNDALRTMILSTLQLYLP